MLELRFIENDKVVDIFEIKKGVGWQFCMLFDKKEEHAQMASFKDGKFVCKNKWISFRALDDANTIYEVKLSAIEKGEIRFGSSYNIPLNSGTPLKEFENEDGKIDMQAFLKYWNQSGKMLISRHSWEWEGETSYTETLEMEVDRSHDILRFYVSVTYQAQEEQPKENSLYRRTGREIKTMTLDGAITFEFMKYTFMEVMKNVTKYCERNNLTISVRREDYMMAGHCIDIPYTIVETERFKIAFEFEVVNMVYIKKCIMDDTYYMDASGSSYNIGTIVREIHKESASGNYLSDDYYGATDICKRVYSEDDEYIFGCWFL